MAKVVICECGATVRAETDDELVAGVEAHVQQDHPELVGQMSRDQILAMAEEAQLATILVHIATGPENPTRAALGLLVARTAVEEGHEVRAFLAGDAVHLAREETAGATTGIGTGSVAEHLQALKAAGVTVFLSGMSSKARGIEGGEGFELAPPQKLVELATTSDTVLTY